MKKERKKEKKNLHQWGKDEVYIQISENEIQEGKKKKKEKNSGLYKNN